MSGERIDRSAESAGLSGDRLIDGEPADLFDDRGRFEDSEVAADAHGDGDAHGEREHEEQKARQRLIDDRIRDSV